MRGMMGQFGRLTVAAALLALPLAACSGEGPPVEGLPTEGPTSEFSLSQWQAGTRYSALDQITADNVRSLEVAWEYHTGEIDTTPGAMIAFEDEPILVEGNLIICTISRRVIALDPVTGQERWAVDPGGAEGVRIKKCRGVTAWTDPNAAADAPCRTRILWATVDRRLLAVDAKTGTACQGFGRNGVVTIEPTVPEIFPGELSLGSRPAVVNGVVIIGSAVADNQRLNGPSGRVVAFDARTGAPRWTFDPLPRASDRNNPASRTWTNGGNAGELSGANVWSTMSADEEHDLVYLPTTSPSGDFYGAGRPGDNLYANSLVAVRASTGQVVWHFQFVHHDVWDYDLPVGPLLIDYPVNGQNVPALVQLTKQGMIFIFNRLTGEPLAPIEERPVPQGGAPGEVLSPTQPFPVGMPNIVAHSFNEEDAWGFTPFDRGSCRDRVRELQHGSIYTPPSTQGTIYMPGPSGGANWGGGSYDPATNILIVPSSRVPMVMTLIPRAEFGAVETSSIETRGAMNFPIEGSDYAYRMEPLMSSFGAPCSAPPWAALVAVNIVTREIVWERPLGTIERLAPVPIPMEMGTPGAGGPLATAGGVVFIGYSLDHRFRAFDSRTGEQLWQSRSLPAPANSTPITYQAGGSQYVVIAAGGHSMYGPARSDTVMAYRLRRQ